VNITRPGRATAGLLGALALTLLAARPAQARLIDVYAAGTAGGVTGWGTTPKTPDFFSKTSGAGFGFDLGLKLLFLNFDATFLQVLNGTDTEGTIIQFLLGGEVDIPLGKLRFKNGEPVNVLKPKLAVGFGFGSPHSVHAPLTDDQISDKGVVADAILGYEYYVNPYIAIGAEATFGWHYFFGGDVVNSPDIRNHSNGYHLIGLGTVTFHLGH
jgi:hypothetical protein